MRAEKSRPNLRRDKKLRNAGNGGGEGNRTPETPQQNHNISSTENIQRQAVSRGCEDCPCKNATEAEREICRILHEKLVISLSVEDKMCEEKAAELTDLIELLQSLSHEFREVVCTLPNLTDEMKRTIMTRVKSRLSGPT